MKMAPFFCAPSMNVVLGEKSPLGVRKVVAGILARIRKLHSLKERAWASKVATHAAGDAPGSHPDDRGSRMTNGD